MLVPLNVKVCTTTRQIVFDRVDHMAYMHELGGRKPSRLDQLEDCYHLRLGGLN